MRVDTVERILRDSFAGWATDIWEGMYGAARVVADAGSDVADEALQERVKGGDYVEGVYLFRAICAGRLFDANWEIGTEAGVDASLGLAYHLGTSLDAVNEYLRTLDPVAVAQLILRAAARDLEWFPTFVYNVIDTEYVCPGCGQTITVVRPETGKLYTECGGEGNGGCTVWIDGDPVAEAVHRLVVVKLLTKEGD